MHIAVMGAGGTGGYFGGLLAHAGNDVTFLARGPHLEAMRADGLTVKSTVAGDLHLSVQATDNPKGLPPVDLVLVCVKTYDTEAAAELVGPIVGPETIVMSVQNGIDCEDRLSGVLGPGHVVGCIAAVSSFIESPGVVARHPGPPGRITLGEMDGGESLRTETLGKTLEAARIETTVTSNIAAALWSKFATICAVSGVTSLIRLPIGPIFAHEQSRSMFIGAMAEVVELAADKGVDLPLNQMTEFTVGLSRNSPSFRGSMAVDLEKGRRLELDDINGAAVRLGQEAGLTMPINSAIYAALKPYADGAPGPV